MESVTLAGVNIELPKKIRGDQIFISGEGTCIQISDEISIYVNEDYQMVLARFGLLDLYAVHIDIGEDNIMTRAAADKEKAEEEASSYRQLAGVVSAEAIRWPGTAESHRMLLSMWDSA